MTLTCSGLTVGYGGPDVVKDVNLRLSSGQVTALIGPNGCGKSTLLKTLGRQLTPSAGAVYLADQKLVSIPRVPLPVKFLFCHNTLRLRKGY